MTLTPATRPIDAPPVSRDPAPPKLTECPRCGSVTLTRQGVKLHDAEHAAADRAAKRQRDLLDRLGRLLDSIETNVDEHGERLSLGDWINQTDDALDDHAKAVASLRDLRDELRRNLEQLRTAPAAAAAPAFELEPWPGDPGVPDEDETVEPDEPHGLEVADFGAAPEARAARDPHDADDWGDE
jgi:hypothetical protein